ncbi:MAG: hypothetical protein SVK08_07850 [Halobacteriota archaeon]|nr:hypothetical protein [Halobacteriota archaeon]
MPFERERLVEGEEELYVPKAVEFEDDVFDEKSLVKQVKKAQKELKEDFAEEILEILAEKQVELTNREKAAILQLMNGNYSDYTIHTALDICIKIDPIAVHKIAKEFAN